MSEKNCPSPDRKPAQGLNASNASNNITDKAEKDKPCLSDYFSVAEMEHFTEYAAKLEYDAGFSRNAAEAEAMKVVRPADYQSCYDIAMKAALKKGKTGEAADEYALAEIASFLARLQGREPEQEQPKTVKQLKFEGIAALTEYTKRGIRLMPCVPVEDDPKRYRPIVGKDKWDSTATADIKRVTEYMSGTLWPNVPVHHCRIIPAEAKKICLDIDKGHNNGIDGEANFYRLMRTRGYDPLPPLLRDLQTFPVRVETPSGGLHLYFSYNGPPVKKAVLAEGVEVFHTDPLTAAGSQKENKAYILHGCLDDAPPLPVELLEIIADNGQCQSPKNTAYRKANSVQGNDDKEKLKARLREYITARQIPITKKGSTEWIKCPLHDDDSPSMQINVSGKYAGILKCHACGSSLDIFGLARITAGIPKDKKHFPKVVQEVKNALCIIEPK